MAIDWNGHDGEVLVGVLEHYGFDNLDPDEHDYRKVCCAFHGERNPSSTYKTKAPARFNCHACGASGDAVELVQNHEGLEFRDALAFIKTLTGHGPGEAGSKPAEVHYEPVRVNPFKTAAKTKGKAVTRKKRSPFKI